jgi:hypothetical protein
MGPTQRQQRSQTEQRHCRALLFRRESVEQHPYVRRARNLKQFRKGAILRQTALDCSPGPKRSRVFTQVGILEIGQQR